MEATKNDRDHCNCLCVCVCVNVYAKDAQEDRPVFSRKYPGDHAERLCQDATCRGHEASEGMLGVCVCCIRAFLYISLIYMSIFVFLPAFVSAAHARERSSLIVATARGGGGVTEGMGEGIRDR